MRMVNYKMIDKYSTIDYNIDVEGDYDMSAKNKYTNWTSQPIHKETAPLIEKLTHLIKKNEGRLSSVPKWEAVHKAVEALINKLEDTRPE